jgi:DegV family protein with EDD domain
MNKIAWITDSMAFFEPGVAEKIGVHVIPTLLILNGESYREYVDISIEQLNQKMQDDSKISPTISQQSFGDFVTLYEQSLEDGYDYGYAIHITSGLSGTYSCSVAAAEAVGFPLHAIDSDTGACNQQELVRIEQRLVASGKDPKEVMSTLETFKRKSHFYLISGNMETMRRSDRVSGSQFLLANMLNIQPIVQFNEEGQLVRFKKVRSIKKAFKEMVTEITSKMTAQGVYDGTLYIGHTLAHTAAEVLKRLIVTEHRCPPFE